MFLKDEIVSLNDHSLNYEVWVGVSIITVDIMVKTDQHDRKQTEIN